MFKEIFIYPTTIIHEFCHFLMCKLLNIEVANTDFLIFDNTSNYYGCVYYYFNDELDELYKQVLISFAPTIMLTPIIILMILSLFNESFIVYKLIYFYCIANLLYAFIPSSGDIDNVFETYTFKKYHHYKL